MMAAHTQSPDVLRAQLRDASEYLWQLTHKLDANTPRSEIEQLAMGFDAARRTVLMLGAAMASPVLHGVTV
jgi:hypothetical protein